MFCGWLENGLPHGMCGLKWEDGTEIVQNFDKGRMSGQTRFIWPDKTEFRGNLENGTA